MIHRFLFLLLSYLFIGYPSLAICKEAETGTLVISYQTGHKGERLDRVRFLLTNDKQQQTMYPKKGSFVEDAARFMRIVIVEDLLPGDYTLEFITPNWDALFEETPIKKVNIAKGATVKIDQLIQVRYASVDATYEIAGEPPHDKYPEIKLRGKDGEIVARSKNGVIHSTDIWPGEYLLIYKPLPGYTTPAPIAITLLPHEHAGPFKGIYR